MSDLEFVEDEFGCIGLRLTDKLGGFLYKGIAVAADCTSTKKKASLKSVPSPVQMEELKQLLPKKSLKEQFDVILRKEKKLLELERTTVYDTVEAAKIIAETPKPTTDLKKLAAKYMAIPATKEDFIQKVDENEIDWFE